MGKGIYLALEGSEGAGKSTQIERLAQALRDEGREVVCVREPGGTPVAEYIRDRLFKGPPESHETLDPMAEVMLMFACRLQLHQEVVGPALERGAVVIADRGLLSTVVYQGYGRGVGPERVRALAEQALAYTPDLNIVIDVPVALSHERIASRGERVDQFEQAGDAFFERLRNGYLAEAKRDPQRVQVVDGARTPGEVSEVLVQLATRFCRLKANGGCHFVPLQDALSLLQGRMLSMDGAPAVIRVMEIMQGREVGRGEFNEAGRTCQAQLRVVLPELCEVDWDEQRDGSLRDWLQEIERVHGAWVPVPSG